MPQSIKFPLSLGIEKDFKDFDDNKQLVAFQLKNVLFTNPGERISIPSFGVGIKIQPEAVIIHNHVEYTKTAQGYGFD